MKSYTIHIKVIAAVAMWMVVHTANINAQTGIDAVIPQVDTALFQDPSVSEHSQSLFATFSPTRIVTSVVPNPAKDQATIRFELGDARDVQLTIVNQRGNEVLRTPTKRYEAGTNEIVINVSDLPFGYYSFALTADSDRVVGKISVVK